MDDEDNSDSEDTDPAPEGSDPNSTIRQLRFETVSPKDDPESTASSSTSLHDDVRARSPRPDSPDGEVFTMLHFDSDEPSPGEFEGSIPPTEPVFHLDNTGAVLVPTRSEPEYPQALQDAEAKLASQIAAALTNPGDEGLNSETFYTLVETFLFPRLTGRNSKKERYKLHQYSQLHAVAASFQNQLDDPPPSVSKKRKHKGSDGSDPDPNTEKHITAVKQRRVPDMTSMAMFEKKLSIPDSPFYQLVTRKGPKICITEIKSFDWSGSDQATLHNSLTTSMSKAHYQNYVAAQYLFREDKHLCRVGSFAGTGHVWSFSEFCRWHYPLLYEQPLPLTEEQVIQWKESDAVKSPRKPKKKAKRSSGSKGPGKVEEKEYPRFLGDFPNMPPEGTPLEEIFRRHEQPKGKQVGRRKVSFLHILDPDGRTYEAFDVIVESMRGWYVGSEENTDSDHHWQLEFDDDPYERGSCPATVARKRREKQVGN
ncbi:hypothetical protein LXA43DRAFT_993323 [Ganoderma leucocontextum]|nr:hypothetical protein LXA43DRAFT_993323 [Ganoderma leucocontextum]